MAKGIFHLDKWYLDFIADNGETMIFYAAKLLWHGIKIKYNSVLHYHPENGTHTISRLRKVTFPVLENDNVISWVDPKFKIDGRWKPLAPKIEKRIFESEDGFLDWTCFQPSSNVDLCFNDKKYSGTGYVEQLVLTAPPWTIPMNELRWGRYSSMDNYLVWIEIKEKVKQNWVWWNGKELEDTIIGDLNLKNSKEKLNINLDKETTLESEAKINSIFKYILEHIPGINKLIPLSFLMAKETKWLSNGKIM